MSHANLRPSLHAALSWTSLLAVLVTLWQLIAAPPLAAQQELRQRVAALSRIKARLAAEIARADESPGGSLPTLDPSVLLAPMPAAHAAADLQARLSAVLQQHRAQIASVQVLPPQPGTPLAVLGLRLQFRIALDDLQPLLHALAMQRPLLLQNNLTIQAQQMLSGEKFTLANNQLDVLLDVLAFGPPEAP